MGPEQTRPPDGAPETVECPDCAQTREIEGLGLLWLPLPTDKELRRHRWGRLTDPWWEVRLLNERLFPAPGRSVAAA